MASARAVVLVALLGVQAVVVQVAVPPEHLPPAPDLASFPRELPGWKALRDDPMAPDELNGLAADATLSRTYRATDGSATAQLFVAWYRSQRDGRPQPHSPSICLPGAGWEPVSKGHIRVGDADVDRWVVANRDARDVVLYWYQTPSRAVASEWAAKFWLMADALRYHRTDTSLVRVVVPTNASDDQAASIAAARFAMAVRAIPNNGARVP
jgi:EpsI family protein